MSENPPMESQRLTGLFPREIVAQTEFERCPRDVIARFLGLGDLTGNASDAMDELGMASGVPAVRLALNLDRARVVGQALTLRNIPNDDGGRARVPGRRLGDIECYHLSRPGDVLVIEGVDGVSSMGGISAGIGQMVGVAAAVVAGSVRDVSHAKDAGFPIWASSTTPRSGKFRLQSVEIMGPVTIGGVSVRPGDLVLADETGVCFVPYSDATAILERAERIAEREAARLARLDAELPNRTLGRED